jgi:hypothetical protein
MRKLIIILLFIPGLMFGQTVLTKKYRTFVPSKVEMPDPLYDYGNSVTYHYNDQADEWDNAEQVVAEIVSDNALLLDIPELPESGTITRDSLYEWNGMVVRCRQTHERTIYDPTETLALFTVYRPEAADMQWIAGEQVDVGTLRIYEGTTYECIQAHVTQSDWTPTATLNVLWQEYEEPGGDCPDFVQPTGAHDSYQIGECVTFNGQQYESLINANVWSPATYPAGWRLIE